MNQKKCPKCGENNPPEAVMCWACYTPLAGGAAAGAAPPGVQSAPADGGEEKSKPPAWQMAIIGAALLVAVGAGLRATGIIGGSGGGDGGDPPLVEPKPGEVPSPDNPPPVPSAPAIPMTTDGGGLSAPAPIYTAPFTIVTPPNPKIATGVMAIMPTAKSVSPEAAASLAAFTYRQVVDTNRWPVFQIFVFNNEEAAKIFKEYQIKHRRAALTDSDYRQLSNIWQNVYVRYEYRKSGKKGVETVRYPFKNPTGWWNRRSQDF